MEKQQKENQKLDVPVIEPEVKIKTRIFHTHTFSRPADVFYKVKIVVFYASQKSGSNVATPSARSR